VGAQDWSGVDMRAWRRVTLCGGGGVQQPRLGRAVRPYDEKIEIRQLGADGAMLKPGLGGGRADRDLTGCHRNRPGCY